MLYILIVFIPKRFATKSLALVSTYLGLLPIVPAFLSSKFLINLLILFLRQILQPLLFS